jgi:fucose permease
MSQTFAKASGAIATGTTGSGIATAMNWIPDNIGNIATLIGAVLSLVLIVYWIQRIITDYRKNKLDRERDRLELDKLKRDIYGTKETPL